MGDVPRERTTGKKGAEVASSFRWMCVYVCNPLDQATVDINPTWKRIELVQAVIDSRMTPTSRFLTSTKWDSGMARVIAQPSIEFWPGMLGSGKAGEVVCCQGNEPRFGKMKDRKGKNIACLPACEWVGPLTKRL